MEDYFEGDIEFLTVEELAERLKVSTRTIQRIVRNKELQAVKVGRQFRFKKEWVNQWLHENTFEKEGQDSA